VFGCKYTHIHREREREREKEGERQTDLSENLLPEIYTSVITYSSNLERGVGGGVYTSLLHRTFLTFNMYCFF